MMYLEPLPYYVLGMATYHMFLKYREVKKKIKDIYE
jgi:hypothetical protein